MDTYGLGEEILAVRETVRRFLATEVEPHVAGDERARRPRPGIVRRMGDLGLLGAAFPEEHGGTALGYLAHAVVCEEVSRVHSSLRVFFNSQAMTVAMTVLKWGSPEQADRYVRPWVRGEAIGCFALTEPDAGSDVAGIRTRAVRTGDEWRLSGAKTWISNATTFDAGILFARTGPPEPKRHSGLSCFLVHRSDPGLDTSEIGEKLGHHASPTGMLSMDGMRIPASRLVGTEGEGFGIAMDALDRGRLSVAAGAVGVAQASLDASARYARERIAFGRPIAEFQMIQDKIALDAMAIEAARVLTYRAARLKDAGMPDRREVTIAKLVAAEAAVQAAGHCVEIHGGNGYSEEYPAARLFRDAKMYQIGEGAQNVLKSLVAREVLAPR